MFLSFTHCSLNRTLLDNMYTASSTHRSVTPLSLLLEMSNNIFQVSATESCNSSGDETAFETRNDDDGAVSVITETDCHMSGNDEAPSAGYQPISLIFDSDPDGDDSDFSIMETCTSGGEYDTDLEEDNALPLMANDVRSRHTSATLTAGGTPPPVPIACLSPTHTFGHRFTDSHVSTTWATDSDELIDHIQRLPAELIIMISAYLRPPRLNMLSHQDRLTALNFSLTCTDMHDIYSLVLRDSLRLKTFEDGRLLGESFYQQRTDPPTARLLSGETVKLNVFAAIEFAETDFTVGHFGIPSTAEKDSVEALSEICSNLKAAWVVTGDGPVGRSMLVYQNLVCERTGTGIE